MTPLHIVHCALCFAALLFNIMRKYLCYILSRLRMIIYFIAFITIGYDEYILVDLFIMILLQAYILHLKEEVFRLDWIKVAC